MTETPRDPQKLNRWEKIAEWPLAAVAVTFLAAYAVDVLGRPHGVVAVTIGIISWGTYVVFAADYAIRLSLAAHRRRWFVRHLFDLVIVLLPLLRPFRLLRLVILVTALQRAVGAAVRGRVILYTVSAAVLLVFVASLSVLDSEREVPGAKITDFGKALWWSITTITTVGYGDLTPETSTGQVIAVLLMIGGISLVGSITATLASWIVQRVADEQADEDAVTTAHIAQLLHRIDDLHAEVEQMRDELRRSGGQPPAH